MLGGNTIAVYGAVRPACHLCEPDMVCSQKGLEDGWHPVTLGGKGEHHPSDVALHYFPRRA